MANGADEGAGDGAHKPGSRLSKHRAEIPWLPEGKTVGLVRSMGHFVPRVRLAFLRLDLKWSKAMTDQKDLNADRRPPTAEELRKQVLEREMEEMDRERKLKAIEEQKHADFAADFLKKHVTEEEIAMVRRLVANAVKAGKFEAMVYSFPSELCTDSGRAINSADPDWPQTLQGKAKEFFERYQTFGKPQGYKLKAMIINFPGGMPGDVGLFLNWAPDKV